MEMIERTSTGDAPWAVVPAADPHYRDAAVGDLLLQTLARAAAETPPSSPHPGNGLADAGSTQTKPRHRPRSFRDRGPGDLRARTRRAATGALTEATTSKRFRDKGLVVAFEGNDAAGKGGAIRRVREALDPRRFRVHGVAAPTDEERARPYLWRFWRNVPRRGDVAIFDRSWYGRVLVERVEGFAETDDWMRAYQEINDFERELHENELHRRQDSGSPSLRRSSSRAFTTARRRPFKRYKLTPEDWRNREKWGLYEARDDGYGRPHQFASRALDARRGE